MFVRNRGAGIEVARIRTGRVGTLGPRGVGSDEYRRLPLVGTEARADEIEGVDSVAIECAEQALFLCVAEPRRELRHRGLGAGDLDELSGIRDQGAHAHVAPLRRTSAYSPSGWLSAAGSLKRLA